MALPAISPRRPRRRSSAGVDIDMMGGAYSQGLATAIARGLVSIAEIEAAVRRVLTLKEQLGLFEDPYRRGFTGGAAAGGSAARRDLAREAGRRSIVVLTNDNILPLAPSLRRVALIGPLADARADMQGPWALAGDADAASNDSRRPRGGAARDRNCLCARRDHRG